MTQETKLLVCDCAGTMKLDLESLGIAAKATSMKACNALCGAQSEVAAEALNSSGKTLIACNQEAMFFGEIADELNAGEKLFTFDIRDRAGWTSDENAFAKQAALTADALLNHPATPAKDVESHGVCLIVGPSDIAIEAAKRLSDLLAVTCLVTDHPEYIRPHSSYDLALGTLSSVEGTFGKFKIVVDGYAPIRRAGRGETSFEAPQNGAKSSCDILIDLTGGTPLFPAHTKRDGYLRPDTGDLIAVERALFDATQLVGTFEKPLHVRHSPDICAHTRAGQTGCSKCLDVCPTGAITSAGESVAINNDICAGCGACAAVCPSGAASFDDPPVEHLFLRLRTLAGAYRHAGGTAPRVLFHDAEYGSELIRMSARFGKGLPADVIPVDVYNVEGVGHAELMAALSVGFAEALVLMAPTSDMTAPENQIELAQALLEGAGHKGELVRLLHATDPETLENILYDAPVEPLVHDPILPLGGRRDVTRLAMTALAGTDELTISLPKGAPYGAVEINKDACTLCLSCVSLCPVGALSDDPDRPAVHLQESACLQCGICNSACPEDAISLTPQLELSKSAIVRRVLHEEEPFKCIECNKEFGVKSTIDNIVAKLQDKHWMYTNSDNTKLIQMCDDCRIRAQYHGENSPFQMGERPKVRTTEDYLRERDADDKTVS